MNKTASNARLKASLEELARLGCPVDLSVAVTEAENEKVEIDQLGGFIDSHLFELQDGRVACMARLAVTNQTSRTIHVIDVELQAPWDNSRFEWLQRRQVQSLPRRKRVCCHWVYQFPGDGLEFECREVINYFLLERKRLPAKQPLDGWLLWTGGFMPAELRHGQLQDMHLTIIGADYAEYSTTISLWTDRLQARTKIVKTRTSIFAKPVEEEAMVARDVNPSSENNALGQLSF